MHAELGTNRYECYFVRGKQEITPGAVHCEVLDNEPIFSTGYDILVAKMIAVEMLYAYLTSRRRALLSSENENTHKLLPQHRWTGKIVHLVELIYALDSCKCIDNGDIKIEDLASYLSMVFGIDIKNCFNTYVDMKKRKGDSRTYFLDELAEKLNKRMDGDDEK